MYDRSVLSRSIAACGLVMSSAMISLPALAQIEEIIVTASKRSESLQDSSLIISAFGNDALAESGATDVTDLSGMMPGLQVGLGGPALQVYIRGVGNPGSTAGTNPAVAINKGGVYVARSQAAAASFFDLERVEVLKGPQGTLYGRNASGGAMNLIPATPDLSAPSGYVSIDMGNYDLINTEAALNVPLTDTLALRASLSSIDRDGYMSDGTGDDDRQSGRLQVLWAPDEDFSLLLAGQYSELKGRGVGFTYVGADDAWDSIYPGGNEILFSGAVQNGLVAPAGVLPPWLTSSPVLGVVPGAPGPDNPFGGQPLLSLVEPIEDDAFQRMRFYDLSATLEWDLDFATLTVIPAYQESTMHYAIHPGLRYETFNPLTREPETSEALSLEARLSNESDALKWVAGLYAYDESQTAPVFINHGAVQRLASSSDFDTESLGVFGEMTYSLTDNLRVLAGLRYSEDDIRKSNFVRYSVHESLACVPFEPFVENFDGLLACQQGDLSEDSVSFDSVDWKLGLEYDLTENSMLFVTLGTGYKAGGLSQTDGAPFDPEDLIAFEIGSRNMFLDGRLQVNADLFYWDYQDHQEFLIAPDFQGIVGQSIINSGGATIKGMSLDMAFSATDNDLFSFGVEYLNAYYDDFVYRQSAAFTAPNHSCDLSPTRSLVGDGAGGLVPELSIDCSGFNMVRAPEWSAHGSYTRSFPLGDKGYLEANIDFSFTDDRWLSATFVPQDYVSGHTIFNTRLTYVAPDDRLSVTAYVRNITEEESFNSSQIHSQVYQLVGQAVGEPRTYGVRFRYNF